MNPTIIWNPDSGALNSRHVTATPTQKLMKIESVKINQCALFRVFMGIF